MRARREALPWLARWEEWARRRRGGFPGARTRAPAAAAIARAVDGAKAGRSLAVAVVGLRWDAYSLATVQRWHPRRHSSWRSAEGRSRRGGEALTHHADDERRQAMDSGRLPLLVGQGPQAGRHRRRHVSRSARHGGDPAR